MNGAVPARGRVVARKGIAEERRLANVTIVLRPYLGGFAEGMGEVRCAGTTLAEVLAQLGERYPLLAQHVLNPEAGVHPAVAVYLNSYRLKLPKDLHRPLADGDLIRLIPLMGGG